MSRAKNIKAVEEYFNSIYSTVDAFFQAIDEELKKFNVEIDSKINKVLSETLINNSIEKIDGRRLSWPTLKEFDRKKKYQRIRGMFNGVNYRELGHIFGYTENQIRRIINKKSKKPEDDDDL